MKTANQPGGDMGDGEAFLPGQVLIDAYGNGGFRFGDMSHRGSVILLPSGVRAWIPRDPDHLVLADLERLLRQGSEFEFLLLGTGAIQAWPDSAIRRAFAEAGKGLDAMSTGAAVRTYNVLAAERRPVGAALIAVETVR